MIEVGAAENSQNKHGGSNLKGWSLKKRGKSWAGGSFLWITKVMCQPGPASQRPLVEGVSPSPPVSQMPLAEGCSPSYTVQCNVRACFRHAHIQHNMHMSTHNLYRQTILTYVQLAFLSPTHRCVYTSTWNVFLHNIHAILMNTHNIDIQTHAHREWRVEVEFDTRDIKINIWRR